MMLRDSLARKIYALDRTVQIRPAHPIEGTLAGLNSRFYLDRHAR
jgi:hypothetical protein